MIQFYSPDIEVNGLLPESESAHCCRVLRLSVGDTIFVTDGKGNRFECEITNSDPKKTSVTILRKITLNSEKNYTITLAVAPTKNADRLEWLVEKTVELGVDRIVLLKCGRSERKVMKTDRLLKIMVSAMKQSLGVKLPVLTELTDFKSFIKEENSRSQKFFGYCDDNFPRKEFAKECESGRDIVIMIGPEGDFTSEEVGMAVENGFVPVTFGEKRLRTETAGVYAVCGVNIINQRLK